MQETEIFICALIYNSISAFIYFGIRNLCDKHTILKRSVIDYLFVSLGMLIPFAMPIILISTIAGTYSYIDEAFKKEKESN